MKEKDRRYGLIFFRNELSGQMWLLKSFIVVNHASLRFLHGMVVLFGKQHHPANHGLALRVRIKEPIFGGLVKIIADRKYGEVLGVCILGPHATDLINEAALAIQMEATFEEMAHTIHAHPTIAESIMEAALDLDAQAIHMPKKRK